MCSATANGEAPLVHATAFSMLFRHLSVSVPMPGRYPNPIAVWMIADLYGFTGWSPEMGVKIPPDWMPQVREYSAQVLQPVKTH